MRIVACLLAGVVIALLGVVGWRMLQGPVSRFESRDASAPDLRERRDGERLEKNDRTARAAARDSRSDPRQRARSQGSEDEDSIAAPSDHTRERLASLRSEIGELATARPVDVASLRRAFERALSEGEDGVGLVLEVVADDALAFRGRSALIGELLRGVDDDRIVPALRDAVDASLVGGDWREATGYLDRLADEPERSVDLFERLLDVRVGSVAVEAMRRLPRFEGSIDAAGLIESVQASTPRADLLLASLHEFEADAVRSRVLDTIFGEALPRPTRTSAYEQIGRSIDAHELDGFVAPFSGGTEDERAIVLGALPGLAENPNLDAATRAAVGVPILSAALADSNRNVRREALAAIGRDAAYRGEPVVRELERIAASSASTEERRTAEVLLERVRDRVSDD